MADDASDAGERWRTPGLIRGTGLIGRDLAAVRLAYLGWLTYEGDAMGHLARINQVRGGCDHAHAVA